MIPYNLTHRGLDPHNTDRAFYWHVADEAAREALADLNEEEHLYRICLQIDLDEEDPPVPHPSLWLCIAINVDTTGVWLKLPETTDITTLTAALAALDASTTAAFAALGDAMIYIGPIDCSTNPNYPAADKGALYKVSVAGKIGGASGPNVEVGDSIVCNTDDTVTGDHATVGTNWDIYQANIDGAVIGPASATDDGFVLWDGVTGRLIKNSAAIVPLTKGGTGASTALAAALALTPATVVISGTDIDWSLGFAFKKTLGANTAFDMINMTDGQTITVKITNTASNYTATFTGVKWPNNTAPVLTIGAKYDIFTFVNDGGVVSGSVVQNFTP